MGLEHCPDAENVWPDFNPIPTRVSRKNSPGRPCRSHGKMDSACHVHSRHDEPRPFPDGWILTVRGTPPISALSVSRAGAACATIGHSLCGLFEPAPMPARNASCCVRGAPLRRNLSRLRAFLRSSTWSQKAIAAPCRCRAAFHRAPKAARLAAVRVSPRLWCAVRTRAHRARGASETIPQFRSALPAQPSRP